MSAKTFTYAAPLALCFIFNAQGADAITYEGFSAFFSPLRTLYHYDDNGVRHADTFGFPQDGTNTAVRIEPMNNPSFPDEYYMYFYDIAGRDLFSSNSRETIFYRSEENCTIGSFNFAATPSYTDLMNTHMNFPQINDIFTAHFNEYLAHQTFETTLDFARDIMPIIQQTIDDMEAQHGITIRLNTDMPFKTTPPIRQEACRAVARP